jgi:hypothetical protein
MALQAISQSTSPKEYWKEERQAGRVVVVCEYIHAFLRKMAVEQDWEQANAGGGGEAAKVYT